MNPISTAKNAVESLFNTDSGTQDAVWCEGISPESDEQYLLKLWESLDERHKSRFETAAEAGDFVCLTAFVDDARVVLEHYPSDDEFDLFVDRDRYPDEDRVRLDSITVRAE